MFASACVATAPTSGSATGTPAPTARNFDCTATPHSRAARSQATSEYVDLAIFQAAEVELEELALLRRDQHARDLGVLERRLHGLGASCPDDDGDAARVGLAEPIGIRDVVEDERV